MLIAIEKVRARIVRHVKIGPAVVVVITPSRAQAIIMMWIVDPGLLRNFFKRSIALVVKQQIRFSGQAPRSALHQYSFESAKARIVAKLRQLIHIDVNIARNKKIDPAIAIIIRPRRTSAESSRPAPSLLGHIFKLAFT